MIARHRSTPPDRYIPLLRFCCGNVQPTSWAFTQRAHQSGLVPSMGTVGDCFDNALMESFWARMQVKLLDRRRWRTRIELANAIFEYLEIFHNRQRRHTALDVLTPIEYENNHHNNRTVTTDPSELTPQNGGPSDSTKLGAHLTLYETRCVSHPPE